MPIVGPHRAAGPLEGGDVIWLDDRTVVVGRGYRTNDEGIRQLRGLLGEHDRGHRGAAAALARRQRRDAPDVADQPGRRDLAVVYSPLLPVLFREWLLERGITLVEVPDEEFDTMGTNVLALAPRRCLMLAGNPRHAGGARARRRRASSSTRARRSASRAPAGRPAYPTDPTPFVSLPA